MTGIEPQKIMPKQREFCQFQLHGPSHVFPIPMRCAQCGFDAGVGVAFCSRCGTRLSQPRPAAIREYALNRIVRSWWHFAREFVMALAMCLGGLFLLGESRGNGLLGLLLMLGSIALVVLAGLARRGTTVRPQSDSPAPRKFIP